MCGTSLKLGIADITDEYALPISEVVKKRPILEEVQLYGNRITNANIGCEVFATLLRDTNCNLRKLNLHNNDIGNEGAIVLAESLFGNTKLKTLWMSYNRLIMRMPNVYKIPSRGYYAIQKVSIVYIVQIIQ